MFDLKDKQLLSQTDLPLICGRSLAVLDCFKEAWGLDSRNQSQSGTNPLSTMSGPTGRGRATLWGGLTMNPHRPSCALPCLPTLTYRAHHTSLGPPWAVWPKAPGSRHPGWTLSLWPPKCALFPKRPEGQPLTGQSPEFCFIFYTPSLYQCQVPNIVSPPIFIHQALALV